MARQEHVSPEAFAYEVKRMTTFWKENQVIVFSQNIVDLRVKYKKSVVEEMLREVMKAFPGTKESHSLSYGFKLFSVGDQVEALEDIRSGGSASRLLASAGRKAIVIENNHLDLNRFVAVRFEGQEHQVVASASMFIKRKDF